MTNALVALVNPNKIHPPITPYALDILTTSLEQEGFEVEVIDLTFRRDRWQQAVAEYFTARAPMLVGVTIRNTDTIYPQEQRVFLGEHREVIREIRRYTTAPIVAGGVGFSSMPFAAADYLGVDYGVKGPGEIVICQLATALLNGRPLTIPDLIVNHGHGRVERIPLEDPVHVSDLLGTAGFREPRVRQVNRTSSYTRRSGVPLKVDNVEYYNRGGLGNILTKNGCPFACSHCVEPDAKGTRMALRTVPSIVDEMEELTAQGVHDLHTTDSEFNLAIRNSKAVLREIIRRKDHDAASPLHQLRLWIYSQPAPFDSEFAELLARAGCAGVNVAPDHVRDDMLDGWKVTGKGTRYYDYTNLVKVVELTRKHGMLCMIEVLLGMPGETLETLSECIDRTMALDATVVGFTLGLRIFPYSPLGMHCAALSDGHRVVPGVQSNTATRPIIIRQSHQCASPLEYERQFMFEEPGQFRPLYYFSPGLPEDPETIARPDGRWLNTLRFMWEHIPSAEHHRAMLPTAAGLSQHDNNYADNPFLTNLAKLGYHGAFWSRWRERDAILDEAVRKSFIPNVLAVGPLESDRMESDRMEMDSQSPRFRPVLDALAPLTVGQEVPEAGLDMYRLSANESPFCPLPSVLKVIAATARDINRYPDNAAVTLTEAISRRYGVPRSHVAVGCGSVGVAQQLLAAVAEPGAEIVYAWRSFEAYPHLSDLAGATSVRVPLRDDRHDLDAMAAAVTDRTRLIFVCNPNNPTGTVIRTAERARFLSRVPGDCLVVLDEAYAEYVRDPDVPVGLKVYRDHPNVAVLRTFSKAYGLAGLRVGFLVGHEPVAAAARATMLTFSVNALAQAAAIASLAAEAELLRQVEAVATERDRVRGALLAQGWTVPPSEANFLWLQLGTRATPFADACAAAGIRVRPFPGEGVRITIGDGDASDALLAVTRAYLRLDPSCGPQNGGTGD